MKKSIIGPLVMITIVVIKYQDKNQLKWKIFILTHRHCSLLCFSWLALPSFFDNTPAQVCSSLSEPGPSKLIFNQENA